MTKEFRNLSIKLEENLLTFSHEGREREYDIDGEIIFTKYEELDNKVHLDIRTNDGYYFFVFTTNGELIGDFFDDDDEHIDTIAYFDFNF